MSLISEFTQFKSQECKRSSLLMVDFQAGPVHPQQACWGVPLWERSWGKVGLLHFFLEPRSLAHIWPGWPWTQEAAFLIGGAIQMPPLMERMLHGMWKRPHEGGTYIHAVYCCISSIYNYAWHTELSINICWTDVLFFLDSSDPSRLSCFNIWQWHEHTAHFFTIRKAVAQVEGSEVTDTGCQED